MAAASNGVITASPSAKISLTVGIIGVRMRIERMDDLVEELLDRPICLRQWRGADDGPFRLRQQRIERISGAVGPSLAASPHQRLVAFLQGSIGPHGEHP